MGAFTETVRQRIDGCSYKFIFGKVTWHCRDRHLTLRGCVPTFYLKQMLQELLPRIERVKLIINRVDVGKRDGHEQRTVPINPNSRRLLAGPTWA